MTDAGRMLPASLHCVSSEVWWRRDNGVDIFSEVLARALTSSEGQTNSLEYKDILGNSILVDPTENIQTRYLPVATLLIGSDHPDLINLIRLVLVDSLGGTVADRNFLN